MRVLAHLLKTTLRAGIRIFFTAVLSATLALAVGLLVAYEIAHQWPPRHVADAIIAVVAILFAYATTLTVLVGEAVKALLFTVKEAEKETYTAGNIVERGIKAAEHLKHAS